MNIEPLKSFLDKEMSSSDLAILLNELLDDYIDLIIKQQLVSDETRPHIDTEKFIHMLRRLKEVLSTC